MFIRFFSGVVCLAGGLLFVAGCGGGGSTPASPDKSVTPSKDDHADHADHKDGDHKDGDHKDEKAHGHSHERGKMLIADAGTYHLLLTAHLAKGGNELDIFIETPVSKDPQPVALALESFEAQATAGEGESQTLTFEPAPPEERPAGEKARTCSHFVAKAPWMKPEDELLVVAKFTVDGKELVARWKNFNPKKYAHHVE
ncbi:hypothetical protein LBMAG52_43350 [Planctomycetia bacterium]|nr:hypothetical protein LBMAG52_43350 [Planctomycetia bacterium]